MAQQIHWKQDMDVSENSGTPKSSILIGFSIIFTIQFRVPLFLETPIFFFQGNLSFSGSIQAVELKKKSHRELPDLFEGL